MSFTFVQRRLFPFLYLKLINRKFLPYWSATIQNTAKIVYCSTTSSTKAKSFNSNGRFYISNSNVPVIRNDAPDLNFPEGIPIEHYKDEIEKIIEGKLETRDFNAAINEWKYFVENTQSTHGIYELIEFAFKNNADNVDELKKDIEMVWEISRVILHASDFLAYLILSMIKTGEFEEAKHFVEKFTIHGTSFIKPISLMKLDLNFLEQFGQILEEVYLKKPKRKKRKKSLKNAETNQNEKIVEVEPILEENDMEIEEPKKEMSKFIKLIWIWEPQKRMRKKPNQKQKYDNMRVHKINEKKLEKLINFFLSVWAKIALDLKDQNAWERLKNFVLRNKLEMAPELEQREEEVFDKEVLKEQKRRNIELSSLPLNPINDDFD